MRRLIQLATLLALGLIIGAASAQAPSTLPIQRFCEVGNVKPVTQGANATNTFQASYPKCTVTVYYTGTTTKATIFKDNHNTALANPFTANTDGDFIFWAAVGQGYDVVTSAGIPIQFPQAFTYVDIFLGTGGGGGGGPCGPLSGDATSTNCGNGNFTAAGTTSNDEVYGYTNFNAVAASHSVAIGDTNFEGVAGSSGLNTNNLVGIGSGNFTNVTSPSDTQSRLLVGIGNSNFVNAAGQNLYSLGDSNFNNVPSISSLNCGISKTSVGIGTSSASGWTVPYNDVVAIGDGAGSNYGQLSYTTPNCANTGIVAIGSGAGSINGVFQFVGGPVFTPSALVGVGQGAAANNGGTDVVGVGDGSGAGYLPGSLDIVGVGDGSMLGPTSLSGGHQVVNATIHDGVGIGDFAGNCNSGNDVVAIGDTVLSRTNAFGTSCQGNSGSHLVAIGDHALPANTTGTNNVAIGTNAGGIGWTNFGSAGNSNKSGSQNTWIGDNTGPNTTTQLSNTIALGYNAQVSASNQTVIGNSSITSLTIFGTGNGCLSSTGGVITGSGVACGSGGGGVSTVTVNGGSGLSVANLSNSTPAAGTNGINVTWQNVGANVSAEIVGDGNSAHFLNGTGTWTTPAGGSGTVTSFAAPSGSWPTWLVPTVTNSTTTPSLAVAASAIPYSALTSLSANTVLGALTATTPSGLAMPSCSGASNALTWTTGTGFGCNTISGGGISGLTTNFIPKATASTTIGNSLLDDGATTANTLTYSGPGGMQLTGGTGHYITIAEQAAPANPASGSERWYADSITHLMSCITSTGSNCAPSGGGGGTANLVASAEVVSFSATPTFSTSFNMSRIVLTGNITSFTLGAGADGQLKTLCFKQGSGPYTVAGPANVHGFFTIGTTNADWNCQAYAYDNTDSIWLAQNTGAINQ